MQHPRTSQSSWLSSLSSGRAGSGVMEGASSGALMSASGSTMGHVYTCTPCLMDVSVLSMPSLREAISMRTRCSSGACPMERAYGAYGCPQWRACGEHWCLPHAHSTHMLTGEQPMSHSLTHSSLSDHSLTPGTCGTPMSTSDVRTSRSCNHSTRNPISE